MRTFVLIFPPGDRVTILDAIFKYADIRIAFLTDAGDNQIALGDETDTGHLVVSKPTQSGNAVNYFFHSFLPPNFYFLPFSAVAKELGTVKEAFFAKHSAEVNGGRKNCRIGVGENKCFKREFFRRLLPRGTVLR